MAAAPDATSDVPEDGEVTSNTGHLAEQLELRMRELGLNKSSIARNGGPSRSVLQRLGAEGGGSPSVENQEKLDRVLQWVPGSTATILNGGYPTPRETGKAVATHLTSDFENLNRHIDERLKQLRLNKTKLANMGGPSRNTLATLGSRGYTPTRETFERIDAFLQWEPGSALAALRGGTPTPTGMVPENLAGFMKAPAAGAIERLTAAMRRLDRMEAQILEGVSDMHRALDQCRAAINVIMDELEDADAADTPAPKPVGAGASAPGPRSGSTPGAKPGTARAQRVGNNPFSAPPPLS